MENKSTTPMQIRTMPMQVRSASISPIRTEGENPVYKVVFTTGASIRRAGWNGDFNEELVVSPEAIRLERLNSGAAVLDSHMSFELANVIGVVVAGSARIVDGVGEAEIMLDNGAENEAIIRKINAGIIRSISIGYVIHRVEVVEVKDSIPTYRAIDWEPFEVSLVPIPADAGAGLRKAEQEFSYQITNHPNINTKEIRTMNTTVEQEVPAPEIVTTPSADTVDGAAPATDVVTEERSRIVEINRLVRSVGLPEATAEKLIQRGTPLTSAKIAILEEVATRSNANHAPALNFQVTRDEVDSTRTLVEGALLHRYAPSTYKLDSGAREYRGMSLIEIGKDLLEKRGIKTRGMSKNDVAGLVLGLETRGGHSNSDFPYILANVANKTLRNAYEAAPQTFKAFTRQTTNPDFKSISRTQLGDAPSLDVVNENGEFKRGTVGEAREQYALATYGKVVAVTRQVIINDDLGAFTRLPEMFGRAAADLESDTVWGIITSNPTMGDGTALFHANHGNLTGSGTALTVDSLGVARAAMRVQKGLNNRFINIQAKYLIVPAELETKAQQFVTQTQIVYTKSSDYNPFAGTLEAIAEPRLSANSATAWYLAGEPSQIDTIEYAYLEGNEGVYLESRTGFDVDGVELKARLDFAAKAIDHRGLYKNPGA